MFDVPSQGGWSRWCRTRPLVDSDPFGVICVFAFHSSISCSITDIMELKYSLIKLL